MTKYALIFEGPQSGDAETLRKLKGAFIGELNFSIEETVNALNNFPLPLRESDQPDTLQDMLVSLLAAGAKVRVEEAATDDPQNARIAPEKNTETVVFEFAENDSSTELPSPPLSSAALKAGGIPILSSAQSTLLSLEEDFTTDKQKGVKLVSAVNTSSPSAPLAEIPPPKPTELGGFTLELASLDPEPALPADSSILEEPTLEIHFEASGQEVVTEPAAAPPAAPNDTLQFEQAATEPVSPPAAVAGSGAKLEEPTTASPAASNPSLIPTPTIPAVVQATPQTDGAANANPARNPSRSRIAALVREIGVSMVAPLLILIVGNIVFFSFFSAQTAPPAVTATSLPAADDGEDEVVPVRKKKPGAPSTAPSSHKGAVVSGDFTVEWRVTIASEEITAVSLKITPPQPPELEPKDIVAGKKAPLKVSAIEIDDLPLTKVGRYAASVSGPARLALNDNGRALRAVANAQFSIEYKPEDNSLVGEVALQTDAAGDSPLRWLAERSEDSRPKVKLRLAF